MSMQERIAELGAKVEHDEDNLEGLEHALVRANQRYTQVEAALAERDGMLAAIDIHDLNGEQCGGAPTVSEFLADLRTRAKE